MNTSQCAVYQVKETPEYRDVRFRSYEKLRSEGKSVSIVNYQQVYIGRIQPGETPADIKIRLQKQRPKNFKGHSIGCSDVLVITDEGKTTAYYINKDGFIIVPEFLTIKSSSDTRLSIDTIGYEIEGKKGTWLAQDYILMNEKKWFLMEHEEYGTRAAYVILSEDGAVVMNDCYNGFDEEARRNIQNFMQQQIAKEQEQQRQQQMQPNQTRQLPEQQKRKPELANWQKVMDNGEWCKEILPFTRKAAMTKSLAKMEQEKRQQGQKTNQKQPQKEKEDKTYKGKQSLDKLMKQNVQLSNIEITDGNIKSFERVAKKYSMDFSLKKDVTADPPRYYVFFKARDVDVMTAAFKEYTGQTLNKDKKPSVRKKLKQAITKSLAKHRELEKTKGKEKEPSL